MASCCFGAFGQAIGVEVVVDTAFYGPNTPTPDDDTFDPEGLLDGYVSYLVYAKFENPTDVLSASSRMQMSTLKEGIGLDAPCGCWNPIRWFHGHGRCEQQLAWDQIPEIRIE